MSEFSIHVPFMKEMKEAAECGTLCLRHYPVELFVSTSAIFKLTLGKTGVILWDPLENIKDTSLSPLGSLQGLCV